MSYRSRDDCEDTKLAFGILQALVISVMMWALLIRFLAWVETQPVVVEQDTPERSLDYYNPYDGN